MAGNKDSKKRLATIAGAIIVVVIIGAAIMLLRPQERSVAAYCKVYSEEKARLATFPGSSYSSGVFNKRLSDAGEFATSFARLEKVAPDEIRPDVTTLKSIYQKIHDDPSQAIAASLSGVSAETSVKKWTAEHCE